MAVLLRGAPVAEAISEKLKERSARLHGQGISPCLAVLRVGAAPSQTAYERNAARRCESLGILVRRIVLPDGADRAALLGAIENINLDGSVHGCLLLRPLPSAGDDEAACRALTPEKDVDGVGPVSLGAVFTGRGPGFPPCTARACVEMLDYYGVELSGAHAAIIGRSLVVGRPLAMLLQARDATITLCHSRSRELPALCRGADIIIAAAGQRKVVGAEFVRPGQIVLDVGINQDETGKIHGDVDFEQVSPIVSAISPVPGGLGAVTTAVLAGNVLSAAENAVSYRCKSE